MIDRELLAPLATERLDDLAQHVGRVLATPARREGVAEQQQERTILGLERGGLLEERGRLTRRLTLLEVDPRGLFEVLGLDLRVLLELGLDHEDPCELAPGRRALVVRAQLPAGLLGEVGVLRALREIERSTERLLAGGVVLELGAQAGELERELRALLARRLVEEPLQDVGALRLALPTLPVDANERGERAEVARVTLEHTLVGVDGAGRVLQAARRRARRGARATRAPARDRRPTSPGRSVW